VETHKADVIEKLRSSVVLTHVRRRDPQWTSECLQHLRTRERHEQGQSFLADLGGALAESLDLSETLATVSRQLVPFLADICAIVVRNPTTRRVVTTHARQRDGLPADVTTRLEQALRRPDGGQTVLSDPMQRKLLGTGGDETGIEAECDAQADVLASLGARSTIRVPLRAHGEHVGCLRLVSLSPRPPYDVLDLGLTVELSKRVACAIANARRYERAQRAVRARNDMLGIVAHDLRNPLHGIRLAAQCIRLQSEVQRSEMTSMLVEQIERATERAQRLIRDLLDVARMDAGTFTLDLDATSVEALMTEVERTHAPLVAEKRHVLGVASAEGIPPIQADRARILQVFENLIGNAIKFTPQGGQIDVMAVRDGEHVRFTVSDNGRGIDENALPHLFDRFYQVQLQHGGSAGLGLSICDGIVSAHGGRIWVESEPGVGTCVSFTMPLATHY